ncbi:SPOSA6832_04909 [Sporobolomyces salmonicolor]|uniref:SPOSA6832_04909-mRNA-1:cds n=1 Tax=Sporidiobolus salmonicolor TaxID=5005 RepID=A0A0D6ESC2_SPOSA|nr:SPOSA6832_04909 [Sporobolomyces salmonicolor]
MSFFSPVSVVRGHTNKVSRAVFDRNDVTKAYSVGWDHTVRSWDLSTGAESSSKSSDKVLLDLGRLATPNLLATGSPDRLICPWDLRLDAMQNISPPLSAHTAPVSSVAAHPTSSLLFALGGAQSRRCLGSRLPERDKAEQRKEKEKVLAVDRDGERLVVGSEGAQVVIWCVGGQESKVPAAT